MLARLGVQGLLPLGPYGHCKSQRPSLSTMGDLSAYYISKTEGLVCSAIEAHKHNIQLLEALTKIFPLGEGDLRVTQLLSGLACTAYPRRDALYKQLGSLHILRRESALCAANKTDEPILDVLRKAPILSSSR